MLKWSASLLCACVLSCFSNVWLFAIVWTVYPTRLLCLWDSPGKNTGMGCRALLHGIVSTQGLDSCLLCLLHWQADSLPLVPVGKSLSHLRCLYMSWIRNHFTKSGVHLYPWTMTHSPNSSQHPGKEWAPVALPISWDFNWLALKLLSQSIF